MNKLKYLSYCLRNMDYGAALRSVEETARAARRPRALIFCDMLWCGLRYQAGYHDYQSLDFYCLSGAQRGSVLTRGKNNVIIRRYNDKEACAVLDDKGTFCRRYEKYLGRDWLDLRTASEEAFQAFVGRRREIIVKPVAGVGGRGVEKLTLDENADIPALYAKLRANDQELAEELVIQHPALQELYGGCLNTLRLYTFLDDGGQAHLVQAVLKLGNHGAVVDNDAQGGMYAFLDENGVVKYPAADNDENVYETHPVSGRPIPGFQVPLFREAADMVLEAAGVTPQVRYVGWDVAIGPERPLIIEGNSYPGVYDPKGRFWKPGELGCLQEYRKYMSGI